VPHLSARNRRLEYVWLGPKPKDAPTLIFLHEGLGSVSTWRDFPELAAAAVGFGALVYSRAGYGSSETTTLPRKIDFMHEEALDVLPEVLDRAGVREAVLVGHSDGGSIGLIYAGSGRALPLRGLVLLAPHVFVEDLTVRSIAAAGVAYRQGALREKLARHHGDNVDVAFWGWNRIWLDPAFLTWNIEEYLPRIDVPALVIQGRQDEYGTLAQTERIARGSGGPVATVILDGCGHAPQREARDATLGALVTFVRDLRLK
jgi:pimeloyl-ACP methyl ester carboxylesterase